MSNMYQCNVTLLDLVGELARLVTAELWKEGVGGHLFKSEGKDGDASDKHYDLP
jgi:hypothetical protein